MFMICSVNKALWREIKFWFLCIESRGDGGIRQFIHWFKEDFWCYVHICIYACVCIASWFDVWLFMCGSQYPPNTPPKTHPLKTIQQSLTGG